MHMNEHTSEDFKYMKRALDLAEKGCGFTSPNPMVGAVIVKDGRIIGEGFHEKYGQAHAERNALASCTESPEGATMYVTLEPCCHYGKQPPCTDAVIGAGISRVVIGSSDPNPLVSGKGFQILKSAGLEVSEGVMKDECDRLNEVFFHFITTGEPFVLMKYAMTMDGKIATCTGKSKWITGEAARKHVHSLRQRLSSIMVGVGTVIADDPLLTCRLPGGRNSVRIICDSSLSTPFDSAIVKTAAGVPTIIATCSGDSDKRKRYEDLGCRIIETPEEDGRVSLPCLMKKLAEEKIDSVLIEGGAALNWSALESGIVTRVYTYIAPKIFGGASAKSPVGGAGVSSPDEAFVLRNSSVRRIGEDFLIESEVDKRCSQG